MENTGIALPDAELVESLRNEVATLNDQRVILQTQVNFQAKVIKALQEQLQQHADDQNAVKEDTSEKE